MAPEHRRKYSPSPSSAGAARSGSRGLGTATADPPNGLGDGWTWPHRNLLPIGSTIAVPITWILPIENSVRKLKPGVEHTLRETGPSGKQWLAADGRVKSTSSGPADAYRLTIQPELLAPPPARIGCAPTPIPHAPPCPSSSVPLICAYIEYSSGCALPIQRM